MLILLNSSKVQIHLNNAFGILTWACHCCAHREPTINTQLRCTHKSNQAHKGRKKSWTYIHSQSETSQLYASLFSFFHSRVRVYCYARIYNLNLVSTNYQNTSEPKPRSWPTKMNFWLTRNTRHLTKQSCLELLDQWTWPQLMVVYTQVTQRNWYDVHSS